MVSLMIMMMVMRLSVNNIFTFDLVIRFYSLWAPLSFVVSYENGAYHNYHTFMINYGDAEFLISKN